MIFARNGVTYGEGFRLPLEQVYNDEQLASVLNFIGFGVRSLIQMVSEGLLFQTK